MVVGQVWGTLRARDAESAPRGVVLAGLLAGVLVMYATGLLA